MAENTQKPLKAVDKYAIMTILFLLGIVLYRLYYFMLTKNQPLWWDESEYMAAAKAYAGLGYYQLSSIRLPGLSLLASAFYMIGVNSVPILRFFLAFLPALIVIGLTYITLREMYIDKKIAVIASAILAVLWEHVFYSNRFHTENWSLLFQFLAFFVIFRCYVKNKPLKFITPKNGWAWITAFVAISVLFRPGNLIYIPGLMVFIALLYSPRLGKQKTLGAIGGLFIVGIIGLLIAPSISPSLANYVYHPKDPLAFNSLNVFSGFYQAAVDPNSPASFSKLLQVMGQYVLFLSFLIGIAIFLADFFAIKKWRSINAEERQEGLADLFNALMIISTLAFFIFLLRPYQGFEYRWFFPMILGFLALTSKGMVFSGKYLGRLLGSKQLAIILISVFLAVGLYSQAVHTDALVKMKIPSYEQVKDSGIWLKENAGASDTIVSSSVTQHAFYSERKIYNLYFNNDVSATDTPEKFISNVKEYKPDYLVLSIYELGFTPDWLKVSNGNYVNFQWPLDNLNASMSVRPVKVYTVSNNGQEIPSLVIYQLTYQ